MSNVQEFALGGYRFIPAVFQYSSGVAAQPGYALERARFAKPLPLAAAFDAVEGYLRALGRPLTAFAACELRTPRPFTEQGFYDFNKAYVITLQRWGIYTEAEKPVNPVARTNVCPMYEPPAEAVMYAFSYTVPTPAGAPSAAQRTFVLAGGGEALGRGASHRERIVRLEDTSPEGMRAKVEAVAGEMERRLELLGFGWADALSTQAYTVQNIGHLVGELLAARGACGGGINWIYARPPVVGLEFEMDVRRVAREVLV
jgi:hypothetical protein